MAFGVWFAAFWAAGMHSCVCSACGWLWLDYNCSCSSVAVGWGLAGWRLRACSRRTGRAAAEKMLATSPPTATISDTACQLLL